MGGLPVKPKVQGYIDQEVFVQFQEYCKIHGLSQSAGLEVAVAGFLGIKREQDKKTTTSIETSNILASEISKLNERLGILERWKLDLESVSSDISTANLTYPIADPAANLDVTVADIPANLIQLNADTLANPDTGIAEESHEKLPPKGAIAISSSDPVDYLTRKELGKLLGTSHESIRVWEQSGKLKERGWKPVPNTGGSPSNPIRYRRISRQM